MSAAPAMTRQKAKKRPPISTGPEPIGLWKTTIPPKIAARLAATEVRRDDLDAPADLEAAGRGVEGDHPGDQRGQRPRAEQPEQRSRRPLPCAESRAPCARFRPSASALMTVGGAPAPGRVPGARPTCEQSAPLPWMRERRQSLPGLLRLAHCASEPTWESHARWSSFAGLSWAPVATPAYCGTRQCVLRRQELTADASSHGKADTGRWGKLRGCAPAG